MDRQAVLVRKVTPAPQEWMVATERLARRVLLACKDLRVRKVRRVLLELLAWTVLLVWLEQLGRAELRDQRARQASRDRQARRANQEHPVFQAPRVLPDPPAHLAARVHRDQSGLPDHLAARVRRVP